MGSGDQGLLMRTPLGQKGRKLGGGGGREREREGGREEGRERRVKGR